MAALRIATKYDAVRIGGKGTGSTQCIKLSELETYGCALNPAGQLVGYTSNQLVAEDHLTKNEVLTRLDVYVLWNGNTDDTFYEVNDDASVSGGMSVNLITDRDYGDNTFYIEAVYTSGTGTERKEAVSSSVSASIDGLDVGSDYYTEAYNYSGNYYKVDGRTDYIHNMLKVNIESERHRGNKIHFTYGGITQTHIVYHYDYESFSINATLRGEGTCSFNNGVYRFNGSITASSDLPGFSTTAYFYRRNDSQLLSPSGLTASFTTDEVTYEDAYVSTGTYNYTGYYLLRSVSPESRTLTEYTKSGYIIRRTDRIISVEVQVN